ncbi:MULTISPECIES: ROK family transcriptional regulator [Halobacillus]|uniref:ROK family protein n=1 Tax=Halobacillus halophilus (strain ATCC 35676 / DSM 2266 / JCM 20832 / KCTC 3685 / LMG 17431 / NBRC 102448 / NCIMB 2269) TaxID=866895 RepID=I0JRV7_HALH3|nr:ROK family transcriptional regulator [Halobacillus halophilus]ASF40830.1 sugar kinase [Halobacillus halophilus]CCG46878.1 ROK family protein [Halobacillus halophilus DSM 2266]
MTTKYTRGSFQLMKSMNRSIILNMIREEGPISRAEIAKQTRLTPPTVSNIVKELINTQFVIETTQGMSKGGRKPTLLEINADQFYTLGIDVGTFHMKFVVTNLFGDLKDVTSLPIGNYPGNEDILSIMKQGIQDLLYSGKNDPDKFLGIGVGMHGIVDPEEGISLFAPSFQLRNIPIKEELEKDFNMIVKVENDARTMTLGEYWFGNGNDADNMVGVNVGNGIGAGMMIKGRLFHGENSIAGEIGHVTIDLSGPKCTCGNYGCLQTLAAGPAIAERARKELKTGKPSIIHELVDGDFEKVDGQVVYQAACEGDEFSIDLLNQTGRYLGIGLTNLIHTINPKRIIVGGGVSNAGDFLMKGIEETIQSRGLTDKAKETSIVLSKLGEHASAIGACVLVLEEFFVR